jgi:hypothetical protein
MAYKKPAARTDREKAAYAHWRANPVEAVKDWMRVTPDDWQGDTLTHLFRDTDRVAMKAAHGPGKTAIDAWAGWIFLNCFPGCRIPVTAPTFAQLHDVLFPEFAKWSGKMPQRMQDEWVISGGHIRHKSDPYNWFAVARTSNNPANLQGFHGTDLLIIADEASAIAQNVFEVMEGALSEAGEEGKTAKMLMGGNPNFNSGELRDAFYRNKELYDRLTITGDVELLGKLGIQQGEYHPEHGRVYYSKRVKPRYCATMEKKYGKDSAVYDVRVRGLFPRASDDTVIPLEWAERAVLLETPTHFDKVADGFRVIVDPSRGGAAETAICVMIRGIVVWLDGFKGMTSTPQVQNKVHDIVLLWQSKGYRLEEIVVDLPGIGGGLLDNLRRDFNYPCTAYDGGKPLVKGVDPDDDCKMFANARARDWWNVRRLLEQEKIPLPNDDVMVAQLASVKRIYNKQEKILCESKQDMKDRLGDEASPDRADVIIMGYAQRYSDDGVTRIEIREEDIIVGEDRDTAQYADEMAIGLV